MWPTCFSAFSGSFSELMSDACVTACWVKSYTLWACYPWIGSADYISVAKARDGYEPRCTDCALTFRAIRRGRANRSGPRRLGPDGRVRIVAAHWRNTEQVLRVLTWIFGTRCGPLMQTEANLEAFASCSQDGERPE